MATTAVIESLTQVVQDCLTAKIEAGFDANAQLTVDIAREIAAELEAAAADYTDSQISEVMSLLTNGEVDLGPFTDFMNSVKTLLDGDESTEGYQIFNALVTDTADNKQTLITQTSTLATIQSTLTNMATTLSDHTNRIATLEAAQHEPIDCEDCHDDFLDLVKTSLATACAQADTVVSEYRSTSGASLLAAWRVELNGNGITLQTKTNFVLTGVADSCWFVDDVTLPGDFEVSVTFATANPYARSNMMLFGGGWDTDLYCRLDQESRTIKVWMNSASDTDFIEFSPVDTNVYDGNMHTFTLKRIGTEMVGFIDNEYLGARPAYMYAGVNQMAIGMHRTVLAAGLPYEGIIEGFVVKDAAGTVLVDLAAYQGVTAQPGLTAETFLSVANSIDTLWRSTSSSLGYKYYAGRGNRVLNVVPVGASIMEQSFFAETDAAKRFIKHGILATVYNRATSGDTSGDVLNDVPAIIDEFKHQASNTLIVLHVGGNDISQGGGYPGNASSLESNYIAIVNAFHAAGFTVAPASVTYRIPPASNPSEPYNTNVIIPQIQALMPDWIDNGVPVLDLYQMLYTNQSTWLEADGIHPNGFGEASIREYIASQVSAKLLSSSIMGTWSSYLTDSTPSARNVIVNFGDDNYMLGNQNNAFANGAYAPGSFMNTDYSIATGFGFTLAGVGESVSVGNIAGVNELSIRNIDLNRSSIWFSEGSTCTMTFDEGSFEAGGLYTVRMTVSRATATDRWVEMTVGGVTKTAQSNVYIPEILTFTGVTSEALMASGVTMQAQSGSEYGYCSGIQFELEKPLA